MYGFFGCKKTPRYKVDYDGRKDMYQNAKDQYAEGEEVVLYYKYIATDTDYSFYLDGEGLNYSYDDDHGFVIRFIMPDHDVKLVCESRNSMIYIPPTEPVEEGVMLIDSYRATVATVGGDGYNELVLYSCTTDEVKLDVFHRYEGEPETTEHYLVPYEAVDRCYDAIDRLGMRSWNGKKGNVGITGAMLVCKFKDGDSYVRVSSEDMPADGRNAFYEIESILRGYAKDEYLIEK